MAKTAYFQLRTLRSIFTLIFISILLASCAPVTVKYRSNEDSLKELQRDILTTGELSTYSEQMLRMRDLLEMKEKDPLKAVEILDQPDDPIAEQERLLTLVETCLEQAIRLEKKDPEMSFKWYLAASERAYDVLFSSSTTNANNTADYRFSRINVYYSQAVEGALNQANRIKTKLEIPWKNEFLGKQYVGDVLSGPEFYRMSDFEYVRFSSQVLFDGIENRHVRFGVGVPIIAYKTSKTDDTQSNKAFQQPTGIAKAITAMLYFDPPVQTPSGVSRSIHVAFYDALETDSVVINNRELPLAADFTAPLGYLISKTKLRSVNFADTFTPEINLSRTGFYMLERFDPNRIPIITVHGLLSSPITWLNLHNDLLGDPELRKNYQIIHFYYPPGLPIAESSLLFRNKLKALYEEIDPQGNNPKLQSAVIIAHSMGGLITRTVVTDSGDAFWLKYFEKPESEVDLDENVKKDVDLRFRFSPVPSIKRVIFISVPHHGSNMSESFIGWLGMKLITAPYMIVKQFGNLAQNIGSKLSPTIKKYMENASPTSIKGLSPSNPYIQVLGNLPIEPGLPYHSIIGNEDNRADLLTSSDGVVPYTSSHLDGAESELVVHAGHSSHTHPLAVREIKRILKENLQCLAKSS